MTRVVVEADGGSRGNPGPAGYGAVVLDADSGQQLAHRNGYIGVDTNNVAEYRGLIAGLTAAAELGASVVHVRMDSKLVVEQMSGRWQVKKDTLRPLAREAVALRAGFDQVSFEWIPRERNSRADRLANEAMDAGTGRPVRQRPAVAQTADEAEIPAAHRRWTLPSGARTRLVLVRHGATEHSREQRFSGRNELPLTDVGRAQAAALALRAKSFGPVSAVVSSPLLRSVQTAEAIAAALGLEIAVEPDWVEVDFGGWEGMTFGEVQRANPEQMAQWLASTAVAPPDGESFDSAGVRARRARDAVVSAYADQTVVVVTHVTPIKLLIRDALAAPAVSLFRIHLDTASICVIDYFDDANCSVRLVNGTDHLAGLGADHP